MAEKMDKTVDWDSKDPSATNAGKSLIMTSMEAIISDAIKKVVDLSYEQEMTDMADSRKSLYATIVNGTLKNLKGAVSETSANFVFQNLRQLLQFTLEEMSGKLLEQSLSTTLNEAMESLTRDLNVARVIREEDKPRCIVSCEPSHVPQDDNEEQMSKLTSLGQELLDEVQSWNNLANKKLMQVTDKLHKFQAESKSLKEKAEIYRNERKALERVMEDNKRKFGNAIDDNKRKLGSCASSILILETKKLWLEKTREVAESLAEKAKAENELVQAKNQENIQEAKSLAAKKVCMEHEIEEAIKQRNDFNFNAPFWVKMKKKRDKEIKKMHGKTQAALLISERDSELENIMKTERELLDTAISRAGAYIEKWNSDIRARQEKLKIPCQQAQDREDKAIQEAESLAKKIDLVQEELENEKLKLSKLHEKIEKDENQLFYAEAKVKEERAKTENFIALASFIVKDREKCEALMKAEVDAIGKRAASGIQEYVESIVKIEKEMDMLMIKTKI
ncbi:putative E3 ubiquitin-protein ligase RF298 [Trifolium pratense]|uniref:putative E3 ubiquitin-protein ligase RF298 n=1 Tax=Trifolium pratense TaxID=57577 RepID=UPI001E695D89|nr:putative E3 ubiquitin-protein ligase RF298 [Trifolium pratense]